MMGFQINVLREDQQNRVDDRKRVSGLGRATSLFLCPHRARWTVAKTKQKNLFNFFFTSLISSC